MLEALFDRKTEPFRHGFDHHKDRQIVVPGGAFSFAHSVFSLETEYEHLLVFGTRIPMAERKTSRRASTPRKLPVQRRSEETVAAIVEGAARILEKDGFEKFNTNSVAEKAGVSIGSLYQYFPNKDVLLAELMDRELAPFLA